MWAGPLKKAMEGKEHDSLHELKESLPSADFKFDNSDEEDSDSVPVPVFSRAEHLRMLGTVGSVEMGEEREMKGENLTLNLSDEGIVVEDVEERTAKVSSVKAPEGGRIDCKQTEFGSEDREWSEFQSTFQSMLEGSEAEIHQEEMERSGLHRLREELLISTLTSLHPTPDTPTVEGQPTTTQQLETQREMSDTGFDTELTEDEPTIADEQGVNLSRSETDESINRVTRGHKGMVLHSSRFDRLSESELDTVLEAIEEESRESSVSPPMSTLETGDQSKTPFKWESIYHKGGGGEEGGRDLLMEQLAALSECQSSEVDNVLPKRTGEDHGLLRLASTGSNNIDHGNEQNVILQMAQSKTAQGEEEGVVFLDLRPAQDEVFTEEGETSESAKRLLKMRVSGTKSSSEDSDDPFSWQKERRQIKASLAKSTPPDQSQPEAQDHVKQEADKPTKQDPPKGSTTVSTVVLPVAVPVSGKKGNRKNKNRKRNNSSGSLSEEDVFASLNENQSSSSPPQDLSTPDYSPPSRTSLQANGEKKGKKSKKKKRNKGKGRKDNGSGSDGEGAGNGRGNGQQDSEVKKRPDKTPFKGGITIPDDRKSKGPRRLRRDSWPLSSDEDIGPPRKPIFFSHSLSSDGECFSKDTEKVKQYLQRRIESRKPPFLFNTPVTPPLFHQDVSFATPLSYVNPSILPTLLLVLPLAESGLVQFKTDCDLSLEDIQVLRILLIAWLLTLYGSSVDSTKESILESSDTSRKSDVWRPFNISGLLQTIVDGSPCISAGVIGIDSDDVVNSILDSHALSEVIAPFLTLPAISNSISPETKEVLRTFSTSLPLSTLFSVHSDMSTLSTPLSFYWHSFYDLKCVPSDSSLRSTVPLQVTVGIVEEPHINNTEFVFSLMYQSMEKGLDMAGLLLAFDDHTKHRVSVNGGVTGGGKVTLAIAFRGSNAIQYLSDIVGPDSHSLALVTDPESLSAMFGDEHKRPLVSCVHSHYWAGLELANWFGGRASVDTCSIIGVSDAITRSERRKRQRVRFSESESEDNFIPITVPDDIAFPPLISNIPALIAFSYSRILFVASPLIGPLCYGIVLQSINKTGFDIFGVKRIRLNTKRASTLDIPSCNIHHFTPSSAPSSPALNFPSLSLRQGECSTEEKLSHYTPLPSLIFILGREGAALHIKSLIQTACFDVREGSKKILHNHLDDGNSQLDLSETLFHATEYNEECLKVLGSFTFTPTHSSTSKPHSSLLQEGSLQEEICLLSIIGNQSLSRSVDMLNTVLDVGGHSGIEEGRVNDLGTLELLGIKLIPELTRFHAKQIPSSVSGTLLYQEAVEHITGKPALLLVFRGLTANERVTTILKKSNTQTLGTILRPSSEALECFSSSNLDIALEIVSLFFIDKELFSDTSAWALSGYVPSSWANDCAVLSGLMLTPESLLSVFTVSSKHMRFLVKVVDKLTRAKFTIIGMRFIHSLNDNVTDKDGSKSVVAVCVQRVNAVWYLCHELTPFLSTSSSQLDYLNFSHSFAEAVSDVQHYFPAGIHSTETTLQKYYQVC